MKQLWAVALLLAAAPGVAQVADPLAMTTDPADRAVMAEVATIVASRTPDLARLDAVLAKLPRPTPLRGMVQTVRAGVLTRQQKLGPAVAAVEEGLRLLPDDPRPKLVATGILTFAGAPQRAADLWLEASRESPDIARLSDRYVMMALIGRLTDLGDHARADRISARLGAIGFSGGLAPERSVNALAAVREAVRGGRESDALGGVTAIGDPDDLLTLYVDRRYTALWPRIAEWGGADLDAAAIRYLEEVRGDWTASNSFATAAPYARRLASLNAHPAIVSLFLPMFDRVRPGGDQDEAEYLAPVVARALVRAGRKTEAFALLAKVKAALDPDERAAALNIDGSYLTLAAEEADWPQVVTRADAFLALAHSLGAEVNGSATAQVQSLRACALARAGNTAEAERATAQLAIIGAVAPAPVMEMYLCRGDDTAARALVIARLADEGTRDWALRWMQPDDDPAVTPLERLIAPVARAVRTAPDVVAAANRVGRILPQQVNASLPKGFDPFRAQPTAQPPARNAI